MNAICKCDSCGHDFIARVIEDDPTINSFVFEPDQCPECNSVEITVKTVESDEPYD